MGGTFLPAHEIERRVKILLVHEIINNGRAEDIAVVDEGRRVTYSQLKQGIKKYRNRLYELGIRQGDRVGIFSRNSLEFIYTYFATASLGALNVPINFQLSTRETAYILENAGVKHLLTYETLTFEEPINVVQHDIATFGDKICADAPELPADFDENNPCVIIYTSGTTGNPKGAVLSHKNLVSLQMPPRLQVNLRPADVSLLWLDVHGIKYFLLRRGTSRPARLQAKRNG